MDQWNLNLESNRETELDKTSSKHILNSELPVQLSRSNVTGSQPGNSRWASVSGFMALLVL